MSERPHLFVAINYKSSDDVRRLVRSFESQSSNNWFLVIKDNSEDESETAKLQAIARGSDHVSIFPSNGNPGYFPAAQEVLSTLGWRDYSTVTVCNVDLELSTDDFVNQLDGLESLEADIMVVAPDIFAVNKEIRQNPFMVTRPSQLSALKRRLMFATPATTSVSLRLHPIVVRLRKRFGRPGKSGTVGERMGSQEIYAPHGSFITFRPSYFSKGNDFNHPTVLFGEELTVGENVMRSEGRVIFLPDLRVSHREHSSIGVKKSSFVLNAFVASGKYGMSLYGPSLYR